MAARRVTAVYLEVGAKRTFACAVAWPGWCRSGRTEEDALETLADYADRYAVVTDAAGIAFAPAGSRGVPDFDVVARVPGTATTDFGAPGVVPDFDREVPPARERARLASLVGASWTALDRVVASAPAALRKGPRGGGRDRDAIAAHVRAAEGSYAGKIGVKRGTATEAVFRAAVLDAIRAGTPAVGPRTKPWPAAYAARRIAWHAIDHAWEIEDRSKS